MLPESPRFAKRTEKRFAQTITSRAAQHVISSSRTINPLHTARTRCSYQQHRRMGSPIHCQSLRRDKAPFAIARILTLAITNDLTLVKTHIRRAESRFDTRSFAQAYTHLTR